MIVFLHSENGKYMPFQHSFRTLLPLNDLFNQNNDNKIDWKQSLGKSPQIYYSCSKTDYKVFSCGHEIKELNKVKICNWESLIVGLTYKH